MNIKNLSGAANLGKILSTSYPAGSSAAISDRLKRANILRATRGYEASLKLGSGAVAKQTQMKAFKKLKEVGGEVDNRRLINQGAVHTGLADQSTSHTGLANQGMVNKGLAGQAGNPFRSAGGLRKVIGGLFK